MCPTADVTRYMPKMPKLIKQWVCRQQIWTSARLMSTAPLPHSMTCISSGSGPAEEHTKCASPALLFRALPNWSTLRSLMLPCLPAVVDGEFE